MYNCKCNGTHHQHRYCISDIIAVESSQNTNKKSTSKGCYEVVMFYMVISDGIIVIFNVYISVTEIVL